MGSLAGLPLGLTICAEPMREQQFPATHQQDQVNIRNTIVPR